MNANLVIWDNPNFADEPFTEREAYLWILIEKPRHQEWRLAAQFKWSAIRLRKFLSKMIASGLVRRLDDHFVGIAIEEATPHPEFNPGQSWESLRNNILARDRYVCRYCGNPATHCDHVVPRVKGGLDIPSNLVAACAHCNLSKGAKFLHEWRAA